MEGEEIGQCMRKNLWVNPNWRYLSKFVELRF
jgi:hypothetical protein